MSLGLVAHLPHAGAIERSAAHLLYLQLDLLWYPAESSGSPLDGTLVLCLCMRI